MKTTILTGIIFAISLMASSAPSQGAKENHKEPSIGSFCSDTPQTFAECQKKAQEAYKACEAGVSEGEQDSLNMVTDKYSLAYCENNMKEMMKWCEKSCPH